MIDLMETDLEFSVGLSDQSRHPLSQGGGCHHMVPFGQVNPRKVGWLSGVSRERWMNEEGEDNLIQMGFRRYLTVIFLLLLLLAGAAVGAMAALAYTLFWGIG